MTKRTGILLLLLVFPVLVYLFLKFFGQNHYKLPTYFPRDVIETSVDGKQVNDTVFHQVPDFSFTTSEGLTVTQDLVKDKIYVADFFFTTCPGICPVMSSQLKRVQEAFIDNTDILILSHTVDPETDTKEVLDTYAKKYKAIPGKWYFMTGDKNKIYDLAQKGYFISALEDSNYTEEERFVHSDKLILVDKARHIRGYYNGTDEKDVDRLILEINVLLKEDGNKSK